MNVYNGNIDVKLSNRSMCIFAEQDQQCRGLFGLVGMREGGGSTREHAYDVISVATIDSFENILQNSSQTCTYYGMVLRFGKARKTNV